MMWKQATFSKAVPVWAKDKETEKNCSLWFVSEVGKKESVLLRIAGSNDYQVFINGNFCFYGPARAGRGYYRVDEVEIGKYLTEEKNKIEILASAYNIDNFCFFKDAGFLCAELLSMGEAFGETGSDAWKIYAFPQKIRKTQRYSFQRPFAEVYDYRRAAATEPLAACLCAPKSFITRDVPYPTFEVEGVQRVMEAGEVAHKEPKAYFHYRSIDDVGNGMVDGFKVDELEVCSVWEAQRLSLTPSDQTVKGLPYGIGEDSYLKLAMAGERTGFLQLTLWCEQDADVYLTFDEVLSEGGTVNFVRMRCCNVLSYKLCGGRAYKLTTAQPYSLQYLDVICTKGSITLETVEMIRLDYNKSLFTKTLRDGTDADIAKIYEAAVETFRQNTVDIYMDCPSRERAGWLCDSFFTSRVEYLLTGKSQVERAFLANFAMEDSYYRHIPDGMLPMCYPSEHADSKFIPNWAMWFVLELREYLARSGDAQLVADLRPKMYRLYEYFCGFENADGLLEKLESWVFVEWSRSNSLVQDINYPTNMLYYAFLHALADMYGDAALAEKAECLKETVRQKSRFGLFFCDNSVYRDGVAVLSGECTESCQYYAFFTGVAEVARDRELWDVLVHDFGPQRKQTGKYPEVAYANAFIGNYLRCDLLLKNQLTEKLDADIRGYFLGMATRTGTLWEHDSVQASCNHGFASHVLVWLDALGYLQDKK